MKSLSSPLLALFLCLIIVGCDASNKDRNVGSGPFDPYNNTIISDGQSIETIQGDSRGLLPTPDQQTPMDSKGKIAILLPLSGQNANIGQALLQSAQLALFDMNQSQIELVPVDTKGTAAGASAAATQAVNQGSQLILGPLFADSVSAAGQVAKRSNINVIGFTTDWTKAGDNIFTIGILPFDQGARLAQHAAAMNTKNVAIITPNSAYANALVSAFEQSARAYGITITHNIGVNGNNDSINQAVQKLSSENARFDAILIPVSDHSLPTLATALTNVNLSPSNKLWLGAGTWDDAAIKSNPAMQNAQYVAPSPTMRQNFERKYQSLYGSKPPRIASLSYDATALAITLLANSQGITRTNLLNPNGFLGIDGIFRFQENGLAQRGLAIHKITNGRSMVVSQAPNSFVTRPGDFASR
jgi:ABC-type branched-subunit amino acid transport system substrate-binding protein